MEDGNGSRVLVRLHYMLGYFFFCPLNIASYALRIGDVIV